MAGEPRADAAGLTVVKWRAAGVALTAMIVFGVGCHSRSAHSLAPPTLSRTINFGDGISLDSAPTDASPRRTAEGAWAVYAHGSANHDLPSSMTVRLGLLRGSGKAGRLVWSYEDSTVERCVYSANTGGPSQQPGHPLPPPPRPAAHCIEWTFLDANTGAHVLGRQRPVEK